ncbi:hypothetical protein M9Y10_038503 [Tritrichomonas musculus]|uniref:F5/8 type C domain-containing protein n=1 Tax=Tritrichomonas musculus TaxID=1915356 RepID=A0ABR2K9B7_9EUKA
MNKQTIILSAAGLKNLITNKEDEEFIFNFGEKKLKMNKLFAEFISPRVSHIHQCDPTINFLNLSDFPHNNKDSSKVHQILTELGSESFLTQISNLAEGGRIEIEDNGLKRLIKYFSILVNNEELFQKINEIDKATEKEEKNIKELLEEVEFLYDMNPTFRCHYDSDLIDEISSKLSKNDDKELKAIPKKILHLILHSEHFKFEDSDFLFDIINEIFSREKNEEYEEYDITSFYEMIDFTKMSQRKFEKFISNLDYRELTLSLWQKLCEILLIHKEENKINKIEFDGQPDHRFNGIIHHLQGSEKTNICDRGIINATSSTYKSDHPPKCAVDFESDSYFWSNDDNDWLKYDFKKKKIRPTHYSIKTRNDNDGWNPINWFIEVSNTGRDDDWRVIDSREGVTSVSKRNQSDTFDISASLSDNEYFRYIRFRCNGNTSGAVNNTWLAISSLEYFGNLKE